MFLRTYQVLFVVTYFYFTRHSKFTRSTGLIKAIRVHSETWDNFNLQQTYDVTFTCTHNKGWHLNCNTRCYGPRFSVTPTWQYRRLSPRNPEYALLAFPANEHLPCSRRQRSLRWLDRSGRRSREVESRPAIGGEAGDVRGTPSLIGQKCARICFSNH